MFVSTKLCHLTKATVQIIHLDLHQKFDLENWCVYIVELGFLFQGKKWQGLGCVDSVTSGALVDEGSAIIN